MWGSKSWAVAHSLRIVLELLYCPSILEDWVGEDVEGASWPILLANGRKGRLQVTGGVTALTTVSFGSGCDPW